MNTPAPAFIVNVGDGYHCAPNELLGEPRATGTMSVETLKQNGVRGLYEQPAAEVPNEQ